jgi:hypothetical protein
MNKPELKDDTELKRLAETISKCPIIDYHDVHEEIMKGEKECIDPDYRHIDECECNFHKYGWHLWSILHSLTGFNETSMEYVYIGTNPVSFDERQKDENKMNEYHNDLRRMVLNREGREILQKYHSHIDYNMTPEQYEQEINDGNIAKLDANFITISDIKKYLVWAGKLEIYKRKIELEQIITKMKQEIEKMEEELNEMSKL